MFIDLELLSRLQHRMMSVAYRMRAAYLRRKVFDYEYAAIGEKVERFVAACRAGDVKAVERMFTSGGAAIQVVALCLAGGVRAVYMTNNPDKLARWSVAEVD
jgi:hypothetical protein